MASSYLVQVNLTHDTGLPENVIVNTWSCQTVATDDLTALQAFVDALEDFYLAFDTHLSASLTGGVVIKCYDRSDPEPRVPVLTDTWSLGVGTDHMPAEIALVVSFQGVQVSGLPQARRRGRVFLGPFATSILDDSTGRPDSTAMSLLDTAASNLLVASGLASGWNWTVWSTTNGSNTEVDNGWIDNSFDTIRARGIAASSRTLF